MHFFPFLFLLVGQVFFKDCQQRAAQPAYVSAAVLQALQGFPSCLLLLPVQFIQLGFLLVVFPFAPFVPSFQKLLFLTVVLPETYRLQRAVGFHKFPVISICGFHLSVDVPVKTAFMLSADISGIETVEKLLAGAVSRDVAFNLTFQAVQ